jgi:hypothetical protein
MFFEYFRKRLIQNRFPSQYPKEIGAFLFGLINDTIHLFNLQLVLFFFPNYPTALARKVTVVGYRDKVEGRKELALLLPLLKPGKRHGSFDAHVDDKLIEALSVGLE